jgi:hypothetical protein
MGATMKIVYDGRTFAQLEGRIILALDEVQQTYGHKIDPKGKSLLKFGAIETLGLTRETIWNRAGNETYISDNLITTISSDDAGDSGACALEGHTIDANGDFTFLVQYPVLNGLSEVALETPLARASRIYNDSAIDWAGRIYVYEDDTVVLGVPQTTAKIHLQSDGAVNNSLKAATTISKDDYWLITSVYGSVNQKTSAVVDFRYEIREKGKVFRERFLATAKQDGPAVTIALDPCIIVPPNSDFRITGVASTTNVAASAWANGSLCRIR